MSSTTRWLTRIVVRIVHLSFLIDSSLTLFCARTYLLVAHLVWVPFEKNSDKLYQLEILCQDVEYAVVQYQDRDEKGNSMYLDILSFCR